MEPAKEAKSINKQIFRLISDISVKFRSKLGRRTLDEKSNLNILEYIILQKVARGPISMKQVRNDLGLQKAYFSQIAGDLLDMGYIETSFGKDRRYKVLSITKNGVSELKRQDENRFAQFEQLLDNLTASDKVKLLGSLEDIRKIIHKIG